MKMRTLLISLLLLPLLFLMITTSAYGIIEYDYPAIQIECSFVQQFPLIHCLKADCSDNLSAIRDGRISANNVVLRDNDFLKSVIVKDMSNDTFNYRLFMSNLSNNETYVDRFIPYVNDICMQNLSTIRQNLIEYNDLKLHNKNRIIIMPYDEYMHTEIINQNQRIKCFKMNVETVDGWIVYYEEPNDYCTYQWSSYALMFGASQVPKVSVTLYFVHLLRNFSLNSVYHLLVYFIVLGLIVLLLRKPFNKNEMVVFLRPSLFKIIFPLMTLAFIVLVWGGLFIVDFILFFMIIYVLLSSYSHNLMLHKDRKSEPSNR
jgi:hypothetical protein